MTYRFRSPAEQDVAEAVSHYEEGGPVWVWSFRTNWSVRSSEFSFSLRQDRPLRSVRGDC